MADHIPIPFCDVGWQWNQVRDVVEPDLGRVFIEGRYIRGRECTEFEAAAQRYLEKPRPPGGPLHVRSVACGTDALVIALRAAGVAKGDEVIMPSLTFVATAHAARRVGATPVFVDVEPETLCICPDAVAEAITPKTTAVVPVHLYGGMCDMDALVRLRDKHGFALVEDACQAFGAECVLGKAGAIGDFGCFSFFPTKPLGGCGDGGLVVTSSRALFDRAESLARQGFAAKNCAVSLGLNSRLDTIQAVILQEKLARLDGWQKLRAEVAARYIEAFELIDTDDELVPPRSHGTTHAWHLYVVRVGERKRFREHLASRGIPTIVHYHPAVHQQPYYAAPPHAVSRDLFVTEHTTERLCSLPLYAGMPGWHIERVIDAVRSYYG